MHAWMESFNIYDCFSVMWNRDFVFFKVTHKDKITFAGLLPGMLVNAIVKQVEC